MRTKETSMATVTKTETAGISGFRATFDALRRERQATEPFWLTSLRKATWARFAELGFPTLRDEQWRFTNVSSLARTTFVPAGPASKRDLPAALASHLRTGTTARLIFVNGCLDETLSSISALPGGVQIGSLDAALRNSTELVARHLGQCVGGRAQPFAALNAALWRDGAYVYVPRGVRLEQPIHLVFATQPGDVPIATHPRTLVIAEEDSQLTVVESYVGLRDGLYLTNPVTELVAGPNAAVDYYKVQQESEQAAHLGTLQLHQHRDSSLRAHCISLGGELVRHDIDVMLAGAGGHCLVNGLYVVSGRQHVDNHLLVDHAAPHCDSRENFRGILDGQSHAVFTGRIIVRPDAQKTDGKQSNRNLLLSDAAQVNTQPQLEIFADDVKCTHGATVGQIDADALFYLRSRGLAEPAARALLVYAFASESLEEIHVAPLRQQLQKVLRQRLPGGDALDELVRA